MNNSVMSTRPWLGSQRVSSGPRKRIRGVSCRKRKLSCGGCSDEKWELWREPWGPVVSEKSMSEWKLWQCWGHCLFSPWAMSQRLYWALQNFCIATGIYIKMKIPVYTSLCTLILVVALYVIAKNWKQLRNWKQPRCPSTGGKKNATMHIGCT